MVITNPIFFEYKRRNKALESWRVVQDEYIMKIYGEMNDINLSHSLSKLTGHYWCNYIRLDFSYIFVGINDQRPARSLS